MRIRISFFVFLAIFAWVCTSCMVGGRGTATFDQVRYPISGTTTLLKKDGTTLNAASAGKPLGHVQAHKFYWAMLYGSVSLTGKYDLSQDMNAAVEEVGGNAVINAKLTNTQCPTNYVLVVLGILPFIPGCVSVTLEGDAVKLDL